MSAPVLVNVYLSGNMAQVHGGGIYNDQSSSDLYNVVISGNKAGRHGGGIYLGLDSVANLTNVTISGNTALMTGVASRMKITLSI